MKGFHNDRRNPWVTGNPEVMTRAVDLRSDALVAFTVIYAHVHKVVQLWGQHLVTAVEYHIRTGRSSQQPDGFRPIIRKLTVWYRPAQTSQKAEHHRT
jgi:hypothetical protein